MMYFARITAKDPNQGLMDKPHPQHPTRTVFVLLQKPLHELLEDNGRPISQQIDDAILDTTDQYKTANERWEHGHGEEAGKLFCCALCGAGWFTDGCHQCGIKVPFRGAIHFDRNPPPLPKKIVEFFIGKGHAFVTDPSEAQRLEAAQW